MKKLLLFTAVMSSVFCSVGMSDFLTSETDPVTNLSEYQISTSPNLKDETKFRVLDRQNLSEGNLTREVLPHSTNEFGTLVSDSNFTTINPQQIENYTTAIKARIDANASAEIRSIETPEGKAFMENYARNLKGLSDNTQGNTEAAGSAFFQKNMQNATTLDINDLSSLTTTHIKNVDENSSEARAIQFNEAFYATTRSLMANLKTISCYATRKLVNSYYCPLPGMENSYFKGGDTRDENDIAKKDCEGLCEIQSSCLHKEMGKDIDGAVPITETVLSGDIEITIPVDDTMLGEYIEFNVENRYKYDDTVDIDGSDYNITKAQQALMESHHAVAVDFSVIQDDGNYTKIFTNYPLDLSETDSVLKVYFTGLRTSSVKVKFYTPYAVEQKTLLRLVDNNLRSTLKSGRIKYVSNEWWLCPAIHIKASATDCKGEIQQLTIGSTVYPVCVTSEGQRREPTYGAFFSQGSCEASCMKTAECVPTYRHLVGLDVYNISSDYSDIEIGCTSAPSNTSCTTELCKQKFIEDSMPYLEKSWTSDDNVKITVSSGIPSATEPRPRINIEGGLSANGDASEREKVNIQEMSEIAYTEMLQNDSYDISNYLVKDNIPSKSSNSILTNSSGELAMYWNLKANSHDYRDGNTYKLYAVFDVSSAFTPNTPAFANVDGAIPLRLDRTFIIKTPLGYKIIKRKLNVAVLTEQQVGTGAEATTTSQWVETNELMMERYETFNGDNFVTFDENSQADSFKEMEFDGIKNYETFLMFNSLKDLVDIPGVLFINQTIQGSGTFFTRVYSGEKDLQKSSYFNSVIAYGTYSNTGLTYKELIEQTVESEKSDHAFYSSIKSLPEGPIVSDGQYNLSKVKMYVTGSLGNMGVNVDFSPNSREEGKKTFIYMLLYDENATQGN